MKNNTKFYDIGLNLFSRQFCEPEKILRNAEASGVGCIITGSDRKSNRRTNAFIRERSDVWGTAGIHPHNADSAKESDFQELETMHSNNPGLVAVGECGLDFDRMFSTKENQIQCLERHIVLAEKLHKPLFLHERDAAEDFIQIFQNHPEICKNSVVHCFTGDKHTLEKYLEMGFFIGITGWVCDDRRAQTLRDAVKILPLDRVLLETDAPYLLPRNVPGLGRVNVPENIRYVAKTLAEYMQIPEQELINHAKENTERLFFD
ncbi:MAG: TatD family hydrolase [Oscillospiraceae bacterium]|nr:TatD family hydrolase [Oscillospiraceae bacterium]